MKPNTNKMTILAGLAAMLLTLGTLPASAQGDENTLRVISQVRRELNMMPYVSVFDYLAFTVQGSKVTLLGYTVRPTNKSSAKRLVERIEGVEEVDNQIEVLPLSGMDRRIRIAVRANLQRFLPRYFAGTHASIRIIVKNGNVILKGYVDRESDKNMATIQTNAISGVFDVTNDLVVLTAGREERNESGL